MIMTQDLTIVVIPPHEIDSVLPDLADLLLACVLNGASVGFVWPATIEQMMSFWQKLHPSFVSGERRLLVARQAGRLVGTVTLSLGMPANGSHRAEINKLLVHPAARRLGLGRALMQRVEAEAVAAGRQLLLLDTVTGSPAQALYAGLGYQLVGVVPAYARRPQDDGFDPTSVMCKSIPTQR